MKILGVILILFGIADLIGRFMGVDVWEAYIGLELPSALSRFSAYIEIAIGYFLFTAAMRGDEVVTD